MISHLGKLYNDEAFQELFPNHHTNIHHDHHHQQQQGSESVPPKDSLTSSFYSSSSLQRKQTRILSDIFGGSKHVVTQLMHHHHHHQQQQQTQEGCKKPFVHTNRVHIETTINPQHDKYNDDDNKNHNNNIIKKNKTIHYSSGLDSILNKIDAPDKVNTLTKTSVDWEQFKDEHNLEDELAKKAQSKDAYLLKQEFLQRVDLRRFEHEKTERDRKRAASEMGTKTK